jgi:SAM-dependent methyltransferase
MVAETYEQARSLTIGLDYVQAFLRRLPSQPEVSEPRAILDIGCGTGIPLARHLALSGAKVIGLDISTEMLKKARANVPNASFISGDILTARIEGRFDGVLAWDSLFHIPLEKQEEALRKVIGLLKPNGVFLFTTGGERGELVAEMFDREFYYSSLSVEEYENMLVTENCHVIISETDDPRSHGHRVICCRKYSSLVLPRAKYRPGAFH